VFTQIQEGLWLSLVDTNPLADLEAHPDKSGNAVDLGGRSPGDWASKLQEALRPVATLMPTWMAELPLAQHRVLPVGFEPERHLSATYREAPGTCYLSLHPEPLTLAEALIHETQHSKLGVALHLDALLKNGRSAWTPSPVRPDLRPLIGVLLAVHAFVPVAALHARLQDSGHPWCDRPGFERRMREVLAGNARGLQTLERLAEATALGGRLLFELRRLHDATAARVPDLVVAADAMPPG
jgi:HEXXH motif-containing protein